MRARIFDHIDLRVKDLNAAAIFYWKFLPQLGFAKEKREPAPEGSPGPDYHTFYSAGGDGPSEFFGLTEDENHRPNANRIAFWADAREKVDAVAKLIREAGGKNLEGPEICAEYSMLTKALISARSSTPSLADWNHATGLNSSRFTCRWHLSRFAPRLQRAPHRRFPRACRARAGINGETR